MAKSIFGNLFSFDKMISEQIIKIVYYIGLLGIALSFLGAIFASFQAGLIGFLPTLLGAIIAAALGVLLWRVFCECIIIIFRIYSRLGDINKTLGGTNKEAAIPGDDALKAAREAAIKAKNAAMDTAETLKNKVTKDDDVEPMMEAKPAAPAPKRPAVKKKPAAKKTPAKKPAAKKKAAPKKAVKKKTPAKKK
ncbi:MAG: DUF4282 domain-containing protein [Robiginitomaculum sp.]